MVSEDKRRATPNYDMIDRFLKRRGISETELSIRLGYSRSYYRNMKANNGQLLISDLMKIKSKGVLDIRENINYIILDKKNDQANSTTEDTSVEGIKAKNAPTVETIINESETKMDDDFTEEIHKRIIKNLQKKICEDLKEMAKKYGLEVADIIALGMKF